METINLLEAQATLERKRELLRPTALEPISLPDFRDEVSPEKCPNCGSAMTRYHMFKEFSDRCSPCGIKEQEKREAIMAEKERKQKEAYDFSTMKQRLFSCNVGERFKGMAFDDYKPTCDKAKKILSGCQNYVSGFETIQGASLLMLGSPGTGKNMLAAIIGQEVIKLGKSFFHTTALKLVRRVKDSWRNKEESEQTVIDSFVAPSLLVIDEIGVQFGTPTEQLFLTEVINERYEKRRPTILISNLTLSQLTETMGARVIDRFYDDGSMIMVFDWQSFRRK